ncbi:MAG: glycoside hydrolase family 2 protein [Lachnospiraceae bacterium]|nr:glycoside hydrolase family 2 protein [Lachnospiraceae bacterium]
MYRRRFMIYIDNDWYFAEEFSDELLKKGHTECSRIRLPHTVAETPLHYFDESIYQKVSGYKRVITYEKDWKDKCVLLTFEGVAHDATVYLNGRQIGEHHTGYTAFTVDLTGLLKEGDNELVVRCDSRETLNTPPFGNVIDYMTYGGIYRDVYLDIRENTYLDDVFVTTSLAGLYKNETGEGEEINEIKRYCRKAKVSSTIRIKCMKLPDEIKERAFAICQYIRKYGSGDEFEPLGRAEYTGDFLKEITEIRTVFETKDVELWDVDDPVLYELKTETVMGEDVIDERYDRFGFRKAVFKKEGFYLNGRRLKIRGLNRHQSYPYVGYAMPESMQKMDADILKYELGVNAVRTSHYPQSQYFINRCDELGLLVFTEMPGWQHIGDAHWKAQAIENLREMIEQYRNHPSIILWGVRINESVDDDEFYRKTNELAHKLDPSRQTGGVRCYKKGSFLEDVYTYNDFSHIGTNRGVEKKENVTSDPEKPYMVTEYNGHMYPTKAFDWEEHRLEHMLRHANVLDGVAAQKQIAGSFGWCMFDYNTHMDFGSGDRICYHGVMDMFRNPKLAAYVYAGFSDRPVLELSSTMDIGEHPGSNRGKVYIITNLDSVKMYKNGVFIKEYKASDSSYKNIPHGPIMIDDYIGDSLSQENTEPAQAAAVKKLLNETANVGLYNLSKAMWVRAGHLMLRYGMKMSDAVELYNKYIGDWGGSSRHYVFEGFKDGELVKTLTVGPISQKMLELKCDHTELKEGYTYDVAAVRIRAVDENGCVLPFCNDPLALSVKGPIEIIGPDMIGLSGGMSGTYIRTTGKKGKAKLIVKTAEGGIWETDFKVV